MFDRIKTKNICFLELVHFELATVLSRKIPHNLDLSFLEKFESIGMQKIILSPEETNQAWQEFSGYTKKNISFVDCANLIIAKNNNAKIASFDKFYPKKFLA